MKDFKEVIAKPRLLALYAHLTLSDHYFMQEVRFVDYDEHYESLPAGQKREVPQENAVRITEPVAITLQPIDNDTIVRNAVASLDEEERRAMSELNKKIADIRERKSQLLTLTFDPEVRS